MCFLQLLITFLLLGKRFFFFNFDFLYLSYLLLFLLPHLPSPVFCHFAFFFLHPTSNVCWITLTISVAMQRSVSYKFDNILVLDYYLSAAVWSPPSGHCSRLDGGWDGEKQGRTWLLKRWKRVGERWRESGRVKSGKLRVSEVAVYINQN